MAIGSPGNGNPGRGGGARAAVPAESSSSGPDLHGAPVLVVPHHHAARIARQAQRRFRGNARPVLEHGLAGLLRIGERRRIDMDHHLVALARRAGIKPVVEGRLREQGQRVGPLLGHRRALGGGIRRGIIEARDRPFAPAPLVQRLAGRGQRLHEQRAHLRLQPPAEHDRAVLVLVDVQRPARVLALGLPRLGLAIDAAPAAHDALDVRGRAAAPDPEQPRTRSPGVATRVRARTLAYDNSPRASAWASSGSVARARATRTFSRAVPRSRPIRQLSQSAQERNPLHQPPRASNSRIRSRRRAEAASRCADSSAI
mgnify:CR=1 FL=1